MSTQVKVRFGAVVRNAFILQTLLFGIVLTYWNPFYKAGSKASIDPEFALKIIFLMFLGVLILHMGVIDSLTNVETYMVDKCGGAASLVSEDIAPAQNPADRLKNH